jgi:hypothetical protein
MIVVACGKKKKNAPAAAKDLYIGTSFVLARKAAEATGEPWMILSARHGLVSPDLVLAPYDQTLRTRADAARLTALLRRQRLPLAVVSWCPDLYNRALEGAGVRVAEPLRGMRFGYRSQYWARIAARRRGAA